jgi:tRNA1Val (adenine37-N6)-methyltransferase
MASTFFQFKQFVIHHDKATMKVGTDGVLLGAWINLGAAKNILDIGTGSGVIALMLAQRTSSDILIDAVEIEIHNAAQAKENVQQSPWKNKVEVYHAAIQEFHPQKKYDLIVSNPPYFINSYQPPDEKRTTARHTVVLSFMDLIKAVIKLMSETGRFNVVLPFQEGMAFITLALQNNLHCTRKWRFRSRKEKPVERLLLEFSYQKDHMEENEIILYLNPSGEAWSEPYKELTRDFYLKI